MYIIRPASRWVRCRKQCIFASVIFAPQPPECRFLLCFVARNTRCVVALGWDGVFIRFGSELGGCFFPLSRLLYVAFCRMKETFDDATLRMSVVDDATAQKCWGGVGWANNVHLHAFTYVIIPTRSWLLMLLTLSLEPPRRPWRDALSFLLDLLELPWRSCATLLTYFWNFHLSLRGDGKPTVLCLII